MRAKSKKQMQDMEMMKHGTAMKHEMMPEEKETMRGMNDKKPHQKKMPGGKK